MANYRIRCEVVRVDPKATCQKVGDAFEIGRRTPAGMCCRAFTAVYPPALAMRFCERMAWESEEGHLDVMCPDQLVVYRLTRIAEPPSDSLPRPPGGQPAIGTGDQPALP